LLLCFTFSEILDHALTCIVCTIDSDEVQEPAESYERDRKVFNMA
jgi:hypothetical protein